MSEEAATLNPSIVVLKTGDKLITILQEVFEGEGEDRKGVCLVMNYPYELELISVPNPEDPARDLQVKFSKWCPYSVDNTYRIPYDGILTIGAPDPGLTQAYRAKIDEQQDKNPKHSEQRLKKQLVLPSLTLLVSVLTPMSILSPRRLRQSSPRNPLLNLR